MYKSMKTNQHLWFKKSCLSFDIYIYIDMQASTNINHYQKSINVLDISVVYVSDIYIYIYMNIVHMVKWYHIRFACGRFWVQFQVCPFKKMVTAF